MNSMARRSAAFTLLELLVSLALMAALFVALNQFVFSMGELWGRGAQERLFEQHVNAVSYHLQTMMQNATNRTVDSLPISVGPVRTAKGIRELLTLELPHGDRVLTGPHHPLPEAVCALEVRAGEGLLLHWRSRLETGFKEMPARTIVLSPFGKRMEYEYYDRKSGSWQVVDSLQGESGGSWRVPFRLHVHFARDNLTAVRNILVPIRQGALPAF